MTDDDAGAAPAYMLDTERYRPRLLDLCCGAGLISKGYHEAGFDVFGVDIAPQKHYPYEFRQDDAIEFLRWQWTSGRVYQYDAIHASPPCQRHSRMSNCRPGLSSMYDDLIDDLRVMLAGIGLPYVIENVEGSPLRDPVMLCGFMFGRELYRHRLFETNWPLSQPDHPEHTIPASKAGHWVPGTVMSVAGHVAPMWKAREVMECDWTTRDELVEGVPPYYVSEHVGRQLLAVVEGRA